jgi:hypothetical protein
MNLRRSSAPSKEPATGHLAELGGLRFRVIARACGMLDGKARRAWALRPLAPDVAEFGDHLLLLDEHAWPLHWCADGVWRFPDKEPTA